MLQQLKCLLYRICAKKYLENDLEKFSIKLILIVIYKINTRILRWKNKMKDYFLSEEIGPPLIDAI